VVIASGDDGLRSRLAGIARASGAEVVRSAVDGEQALLACGTEEPDVVFLDEELAGISGSSVAAILAEMDRPVRALVVHRGELSDRPDALDLESETFDDGVRSVLTPGAVHVFVVDDHETVRLGLQMLFEEEPDIAFAGSAENGSLALEGIARTRPDVALLDLRLPDVDGIDLCREVRSRFRDVRCLIFTAYSDDEAQVQAILAGASGYLSKGGDSDELLSAIRTVASGSAFVDPERAGQIMRSARTAPGQPEVNLSAQQERVLELIVEGLTNREISQRLDLAEKTVKNYVSAVLDKLGVRSRTQAAVYRARLKRDERHPDAS